MKNMPFRKIIIGGVVLTLVLVGVYTLGQFLFETTIRYQIQKNLPEGLESRDIDFQLLPAKIVLDQPRFTGTPSSPHKLNSILINPNVRSLFGDTLVIDSIEIESPVFRYYLGAEESPAEAPEELLSGLFTTGETDRKVVIKNVSVRNASLRFYDNRTDPEPRMVLSPLEANLGPISARSLRQGMTVTATSGFGNGKDVLGLDARLVPQPSFRVDGMVQLKHFPLSKLPSAFTGAAGFDTGSLSGNVPVTYENETISLSSSTLTINEAQMRFVQQPPAEEPVETIESPGMNFPEIAFTSLRADVINSTLELPSPSSNEDPFSVSIREGAILLGQGDRVYQASDQIPLQVQCFLDRPAGLFELKSLLTLADAGWALDDLLSQVRLDRIQEINPLVKPIIPFQFRSGQLESGLQGRMSSTALDLQLDLHFNKLRLDKASAEDVRFLGIPTSTYVNHLSREDGSLELVFRVTGSPSNPTVDISTIRNRILLDLGIDAGVLAALGLPAYLGSKVVEKATGINILREAQRQIGGLLSPADSARSPGRTKKPKNEPGGPEQ